MPLEYNSVIAYPQDVGADQGVVLNTTHLKCAQNLCTSEQLHKELLAYVYYWPCQFSPSRLFTASAVVDQVCFYP